MPKKYVSKNQFKVGDLVKLKVKVHTSNTAWGTYTYGPRADNGLSLALRMLDGTVGEVTRGGTKSIYVKFVTTSPSGRTVEQEHRLEEGEWELVFSA